MPSVSKSQQRLMGWARAVQKGEAKDAPDNVKQVAKTMKPKDLHDFASTKHDDLPEKAEKEARAKVAVFLIREAAGTDALVKSASKKQLFKYLKKAAQRFYRGEALAPALQAEFPGLSKEAAYKVARHVIVNGLKEASCGEPACPPHLPHKPKKKKAIIEKKSTIGPGMAGQQNAGASYGSAPSMSMTATGTGMSSALGSMGGTSAVGGLAKQANIAALLRTILRGAGNGVTHYFRNRALSAPIRDLIGRNQMAVGGGLGAAGAAGGKLLYDSVGETAAGNLLLDKQSDVLDTASNIIGGAANAPANALKSLQTVGGNIGEGVSTATQGISAGINKALGRSGPSTAAQTRNKMLYGQPGSIGHSYNKLQDLQQRQGQQLHDTQTELNRVKKTPIPLAGGFVNQEILDKAQAAQAEANAANAGGGEQGPGFFQNPYVQGGLAAGGSLLGVYALMQLMKKKREQQQMQMAPQMPMMMGGGGGNRSAFFF